MLLQTIPASLHSRTILLRQSMPKLLQNNGIGYQSLRSGHKWRLSAHSFHLRGGNNRMLTMGVSSILHPGLAGTIKAVQWISTNSSRIFSPAVAISSIVLMAFWLNLRMTNFSDRVSLTDVRQALLSHKNEKMRVLRSVSPITFISTFFMAIFWSCFPIDQDFWKFGPALSLVGCAFGFWAAEATMDCCLDECKSAKPYSTVIFTIVIQLLLIIKLGTNILGGGGHSLFLFKAIEVLLATFIAKTIDNIQWGFVAAACSTLLALSSLLGQLPAIPMGLPRCGWQAYVLATVGASTAYQIVQNASVPFGKVRRIHQFRGMARIGALLAGAPPSWILFDIWNFQVFMVWKVIVDYVALHAISQQKT